jgi:hypothetical protein
MERVAKSTDRTQTRWTNFVGAKTRLPGALQGTNHLGAGALGKHRRYKRGVNGSAMAVGEESQDSDMAAGRSAVVPAWQVELWVLVCMVLRAHFRLAISLVVLLSAALGCAPESSRSPQGHLYSTRRKMEADKLASVWLIKRFVDSEASVQFVGDELPLTNGIPLDAPEGELRRYANNSCFETIVNKYRVQAPGIQRMARIIRDIEINYWAEKYFPETVPLSQEIKTIIDRHPDDPNACVRESSVVFDELLSELARSAQSGSKK